MTRLYLVEDHGIMRDGLCAMLAGKGHVIVGDSSNPTQALADLQRLMPEAMLLDLHLGDRSGLELLDEMRRRGISTPCIVLTMSTQQTHVTEALRMGAMAYVLKSSAGSDLEAAIFKVARGQKYLSAEVAEMAMQIISQPQCAEHDFVGKLSPRERQIIVMVVNGLSSTQIGTRLHLSSKTVGTYRSRLMGKLGVADVTALVRLALRNKLIGAEGV